MLQRDGLELSAVQEIRRLDIVFEAAIVDLETDGGRIVVDLTMIGHGDDGSFEILPRVGDGALQIGGEGRDAATAGQRIPDECHAIERGHVCASGSANDEYPDAVCVTYINSSAEVKSISDVIITSSNAAQIVGSIPKDRRILFGPDQHLGRWLSKKLDREMIFWPGACEVHVLFNAKRLFELVQKHPDAVVIAHPECDQTVLQYAHVVGATSKLLDEVKNNPSKKFIVATESGIFHQMKKARPDVELIQAPVVDESCACNDCPYMKMNTLEKIKMALTTFKPAISLDEGLRQKAFTSLNNMMKITSGQAVTWPELFQG